MMADQRTMAQLLQAPTEGYEDAIVVPPITADNFELKHGLLTLVQNKQFFGPDKEDPHAHIRYFNKITSTLKFLTVPNTVRYLRNKPVVAKVSMNTSTSGISPDVAELKDMVKALLLDKKSQNQAPATVKAVKESCDMVKALLLDKKSQNQAPATVKAVEESCVTCAGAHSYRNCPATNGNVYRDNIQEFVSQASAVNYNQGNTRYRPPMIASTLSSGTLPSNTIANPRSDLKAITTRSGVSYDGPQIPPPPSFLPKSKSSILTSEPVNSSTIELVASSVSAPRQITSRLQDHKLRDKANDQRKKIFQIFKDLNFNISFADALILMPKFCPSIKSLLTNKDKLCELARTPLNEHFSAVLLKKLPEKLRDPGKFLIPCDFPGKAECLALADLGASINLMPLSEVLCFSDVIANGNPTPYYDPIISTTSPTLTPFENSDFLLEEVNAFLALEDDPTSPKVDQSYLDSEGGILLLEAFLNDDPSLPPPNQGNYMPKVRKELKIYEAKSDKSSTDEPPEVELKDLPPHLEYTFLEGDDKLPVIIAKDLSVEKTALITVLKSHKRAIAWKLSDIRGIDPEFCTHKILMEEDFEPAVQHQRKVNPKIHDVIKQEVLKLLDAGLIYPISDSPWVSPVHCVPKKGDFTVVENEDNELILTRLVTGWRVCINYRKLNEATCKDHFPLPFMDQMLERLAGNQYYCFLDGFSVYFQIPIDPKDQEKTTFTAHTERLLTATCLLGYAMHHARFRGV
nr:reverse transcriptase domain-containing protein [Tanacetum cinerariifolium]